MLYKWKEGSMSQNGKIILRAGDFIPEGLLEADTIDKFVKKGSIEVIPKEACSEKGKEGQGRKDLTRIRAEYLRIDVTCAITGFGGRIQENS